MIRKRQAAEAHSEVFQGREARTRQGVPPPIWMKFDAVFRSEYYDASPTPKSILLLSPDTATHADRTMFADSGIVDSWRKV